MQAGAESGQPGGGGDHDQRPGRHRLLGRGHQGGRGIGIGQVADDGQHPGGRGIVFERFRGHPAEGLAGGRVQLPGLLLHRQHGGPGSPQFLGEAPDPRADAGEPRRVLRAVLRLRGTGRTGRIVRPGAGQVRQRGRIGGPGQPGRAGQDGGPGRAGPGRRFAESGQLGGGQRIRVGDEGVFPGEIDRPGRPAGQQRGEAGDGAGGEEGGRRVRRGRAAGAGCQADRGHRAAPGRQGGHGLPRAGVD